MPSSPVERTQAPHRPRIADRPAAVQRAAELYQAGKSVRDVAFELGLSYGATHKLLETAGVPMRSRGGKNRQKGA